MSQPKIPTMGMGELKSYLCPKANGKPQTCKDCAGRNGCTAGQRAVELLTLSEQKADAIKTLPQVGTAKEMETFRTACESGNAWGYLEATENISKGHAKEKLISLINRYPAVSREFGGQKQLLKYRPINTPSEPQTAGEPSKKAKKLQYLDNAHKALRQKAVDYWKIALSQPDPIAYHMKMKGVGKVTARTVIGRAKKKYPELADIKPAKKEEIMSDEISIADFLAEHTETDPEIKATDKPETTVGSVEFVLNQKYEELKAEKEKLEEESKRIADRLSAINEGFDALAKVLNMFKGGQNS